MKIFISIIAQSKIRVFIFFIHFFLFPHSSFAQTTKENLTNYLFTLYDNNEYPSISAGIISNGKIFWSEKYGFSNLEKKIPITSKSLYRIASISKTITAVAVMQLVENGKVNLDEDITKYIPYFSKKKWPFTVRQVLNHTSGVRAYRNGEFDSNRKFKTIKDVVIYLDADSLLAKPGTMYIYSTLAYNLLAAVIENVSKLSFEDYLKKNIFDIAGMNSTKLDNKEENLPMRTKGYVYSFKREFKPAVEVDLSIKFPGGGILSTVEDLLFFGNALIENKLINENTFNLFTEASKLSDGKPLDYGLGIAIIKDKKGRKYFGHLGGGTGFISGFSIYPDKKLCTVYLINEQDGFVSRPNENLADIFLSEPISINKKPLLNTLIRIYCNAGIDSSIRYYRLLKANYPSAYDFTAPAIILTGDYFRASKLFNEAIAYYNLCSIEYPNSIEAFNKLGDTYLLDKNRGIAEKNFKKVLTLDPNDKHALEMIKTLNKLK